MLMRDQNTDAFGDANIKVSIICLVYNHEKYLKDTLEGFVHQKTDFSYEVLIHDDASTDNSAAIIREYADKYPDVIIPVLQKENQHKKGIRIARTFLYPICRGKYIALCEGDDYWTDTNKLQMQFDALEAHSSIDMCAHGAAIIDALSDKEIGEICPRKKECIIPTEDVIAGGGDFLATNSLFMRKEIVTVIPPFRQKISFDYTIQINGALNGGIYYFPQKMSVYRSNVPGSWSMRINNRAARASLKLKIIDMLSVLDEFTNRKYSSVINQTITENLFDYYRYKDQDSFLLKPEYKSCRKKLKGKERYIFFLKALFPKITQLLRKILGKK